MIELSATRITTYMDCPLKYRFRYVERIEPEAIAPALAFGSCFHRAVKYFHTRLMQGDTPDIRDIEIAFIDEWEAAQTVPIAWNGETPLMLERQGLEMLAAYVNAFDDTTPAQAVESEFRAPVVNLTSGEVLADIVLVGIIDRLDGEASPVELKTASKTWSQHMADSSLQMTLYSYYAALTTQKPLINGRFEIVTKCKSPKVQTFRTQRAPHHFDQLYRTIEMIAESIATGIFYPKPSQYCPGCDYSEECAKW